MENKNAKRIIIANWKMNPETLSEAKEILSAIKKEAKKIENINIVVAPPAIYLGRFKTGESDDVKLAAQNMHWEEKGAFTGEISSLMLKDAGVEYVIVGHSERRNYFGETDEIINKKLILALKNRLTPILCVGESFEEKRAEKTPEIIKSQLTKALENIRQKQVQSKNLLIAYEPVWAIGSGTTPSYDDVLSANLLIRKTINSIYGRGIAEKIPLLYGGSVNAKNAGGFIEKSRADGLLVGGASIKATEFLGIIRQLSII
ncbi:triose-phosphate isomerase [Patescibacteria group bacterium]|nr:triose-phosphate isomerase [Patescibacteria group bacterium]MBU3999579.1 triose-phosphate isomerase [Patescibacteria group bacterium]MBU4056946.1 triose-phosphate isomerase [Patescibacteria group bacterium]